MAQAMLKRAPKKKLMAEDGDDVFISAEEFRKMAQDPEEEPEPEPQPSKKKKRTSKNLKVKVQEEPQADLLGQLMDDIIQFKPASQPNSPYPPDEDVFLMSQPDHTPSPPPKPMPDAAQPVPPPSPPKPKPKPKPPQAKASSCMPLPFRVLTPAMGTTLQGTVSMFICRPCNLDLRNNRSVVELPGGRQHISFSICAKCVEVNTKIKRVVDYASKNY